ncbi:hypothetical protein QTN25_010563 [Entamoeba marina]
MSEITHSLIKLLLKQLNIQSSLAAAIYLCRPEKYIDQDIKKIIYTCTSVKESDVLVVNEYLETMQLQQWFDTLRNEEIEMVLEVIKLKGQAHKILQEIYKFTKQQQEVIQRYYYTEQMELQVKILTQQIIDMKKLHRNGNECILPFIPLSYSDFIQSTKQVAIYNKGDDFMKLYYVMKNCTQMYLKFNFLSTEVLYFISNSSFCSNQEVHDPNHFILWRELEGEYEKVNWTNSKDHTFKINSNQLHLNGLFYLYSTGKIRVEKRSIEHYYQDIRITRDELIGESENINIQEITLHEIQNK